MPRRRPQHYYAIEPAPQPPPATNWLTQLGNNIPMPIVLAALVGAAVWYGTTNSQQNQSRDELTALKAKLEEVNKVTLTSTKEQDDRRAQLAKEFLASNERIASKVGELATALAVQQETQKATSAALSKISDQLGLLTQGRKH